MSTRRDLIWFKFQNSTAIGIGAHLLHNVTADVTTNLVTGMPVVGDGHKELRGHIEQINVHAADTTVAFDVIFWRNSAANSATPLTDGYIDHESFADADFISVAGASTMSNAASANLAIPYYDANRSKTFHIGILAGVTAIVKNTLAIQFAWRPDVGER